MFSDRRHFRLLLEVGVAESNGVVSIVGKHSEITVSVHAHYMVKKTTTNRCQIAIISMLIVRNIRIISSHILLGMCRNSYFSASSHKCEWIQRSWSPIRVHGFVLCTFCEWFIVHSLAVLKGHPECLKCGKTLWRPGLHPGPRCGSLQRSPDPLAGGMGLAAPPHT